MIIKPDGDLDARILVVGERPGFDELRAAQDGDDPRNFVGPAGQELWDRLRRVAKLERQDCRVANLVPTFSQDPPTADEIAKYQHLLIREVQRLQPGLVITVGYHAARFFLPQYQGVTGDAFHGLPHYVGDRDLRFRHCFAVVPVVHSAAALRQPGKFQQQLTDDCRTIKRVLDDAAITFHSPERIAIYQSGLAGFAAGSRSRVLGFDSEFDSDTGTVQAVTLSAGDQINAQYDACLLDPDAVKPGMSAHTFLQSAALVAHMAKAEYKSLYALGIDRWDTPIDDTMIMAFVLSKPHLGLKTLAARDLQLAMTSYADVVNPVDDTRMIAWLKSLRRTLTPVAKTKKIKGENLTDATKKARRCITSINNLLYPEKTQEKTLRERWDGSVWGERHVPPKTATWIDAPKDIREPYAMSDAVGTCLARRDYWPQIQQQGLVRAYNLQRDVLPFLVRNEVIGLAVDEQGLRDLDRVFSVELALVKSDINDLAGHPVNPLSGDQVSDCLFHELGIRPTKLTKSQKAYTTADKYLKARRKEHEIINKILSARQLNKYIGTYTSKLPNMLRDGRFHPDWMYCNTASARLAEQILLLIPKHDPQAKVEGRTNRAQQIRDCFHATDGHTLVSCDLSQIELRVMADRSRDDKMLRVFARGDDMHADTAYNMLGAPKKKEDQDDSAHRLPAKTMNFGIINGMTEYGMLDQLHEAGQLQWDIEQVREFRQDWFKYYAGVKQYWDGKIYEAKAKGYITTMFGRRRYLAGVRSTSEQVRQETERQCLGEIQSAADDISKLWNVRIWKRVIRPMHRDGVYCEPWIRVHDDTTLETTMKRASAIAAHMLALVPDLLSIPTTADAKFGVRWGSLGKAK